MPEYRVTTERVVEADTPAEAAAISAAQRADEWVVYSDNYRHVDVITPEMVMIVHTSWGEGEEEIVEAEIIEDAPDPVSVQSILIDRAFSTGETFVVEIDRGEFYT